jgi:hypothetical protein
MVVVSVGRLPGPIHMPEIFSAYLHDFHKWFWLEFVVQTSDPPWVSAEQIIIVLRGVDRASQNNGRYYS